MSSSEFERLRETIRQMRLEQTGGHSSSSGSNQPGVRDSSSAGSSSGRSGGLHRAIECVSETLAGEVSALRAAGAAHGEALRTVASEQTGATEALKAEVAELRRELRSERARGAEAERLGSVVSELQAEVRSLREKAASEAEARLRTAKELKPLAAEVASLRRWRSEVCCGRRPAPLPPGLRDPPPHGPLPLPIRPPSPQPGGSTVALRL